MNPEGRVMGDSESNNDNSSPLNSAENDANGNFGFGDVGKVLAPCAAASSPAPSSGAAPPTSPGSSSATVSPDKKHWVEIVMLDQEGMPVPGQAYEITVPDGTVVQGSTDSKGRGRVDGIDAGNCKIIFTQLDKDVWKKK